LSAYLAEAIELTEFERRQRELVQQRDALQVQDRQLAHYSEQLLQVRDTIPTIQAICTRLQVGLEDATFDQRRELVALLIDCVIVNGAEVEIRYVIPTTEASTHIRFCHLRKDYFDPLLHQFAPDVLDLWQNCSKRRRVDGCSVRHRHSGPHQSGLNRPRQEGGGRCYVACRADVDVDDLTILVDGPKCITPTSGNADIRLVKTPALPNTMATRAGGFLIEWSELLDPVEDGGRINVDAAFGQQF